MLYQNILKTIGDTPLVKLSKATKAYNANIYAKLEMFNPGSSIKDRIALEMVEKAEREGAIIPGKTMIVEPTSGNTGIGLAIICRAKGYDLTIVMSDAVSTERSVILEALGAKVILTEGEKGFDGVIDVAHEILSANPNAWAPMQFKNMANPESHYYSTAQEIWKDMEGQIDILVAGIGTGGTISGIAKFLKEKQPKIEVVAVEPESCALLSGGPKGLHKIQGLLAGFISDTTDLALIDTVISVSDEKAYEMTRILALEEAMFCGISSGAAYYGVLEIAKKSKNVGKNIVTIFPDSGDRYISTKVFHS